jgi:NADH pyrophosphatase NudC (nudix superfamily)
VATIFEGRVVRGEPAPSDDETMDVGWFRPEEIDALPQSEATRVTIRDALAGVSYR